MSNFSDIMKEIKSPHDEVHDMPYIARYREEKITLLDHYRHLCQLRVIYQVIENKIKKNAFSFKLPEQFQELQNRFEKIQSDIEFLEPYVKHQDKNKICSATENYKKELTKEEKDVEEDKKIFAHFLVRILGDLFGGKNTKDHIQKIYIHKKIISEKNLDQGTSFYCFSDNMRNTFVSWLNKQQIDIKGMSTFLNNGFTAHIEIFSELENTRNNAVNKFKPTHRQSCCTRFFTAKSAALTGAAVANVANFLYQYCTNRYR